MRNIKYIVVSLLFFISCIQTNNRDILKSELFVLAYKHEGKNISDTLILKPDSTYYHSQTINGKIEFKEIHRYIKVSDLGYYFEKYKMDKNDTNIRGWDAVSNIGMFNKYLPYDVNNDLNYKKIW